MSIRITSRADPSETVICIAGKLQAADVGELDRELRRFQDPRKVDLSSLSSADAEGVAALTQLVRDGIQLVGMSPYLKLLLKPTKSSLNTTEK